MSWGTDLLWVRHLSPPRSFHLPELVPGATLVLVGPSGPSVIVPEGASVTIAGKGASAPRSNQVALAPGDRVTIALPSRTVASGYRASPGEAEEAARIVLEVALVRAG